MWLIIAPFVLGYADLLEPLWNDVVVGAAVAAAALRRMSAPLRHRGFSWLSAALGVWLMFAPFLLGYTVTGEEIARGAAVTPNGTVAAIAAEAAYGNDVLVGAVVAILAVWSAALARQLAAPIALPQPVTPGRNGR